MHENNDSFNTIGWEMHPKNERGIHAQLKRLEGIVGRDSQEKSTLKEIKQAISKSTTYAYERSKDGSNYASMIYHIIAEDSLSPRAIFPVHIGSLVDKAYKTCSSKYRKEVKVVEGEDGIVEVAPMLVVGVLKNMIKNAVWHGGATTVILTWDAAKGTIMVNDNGIGIPPHKLPYIFASGFSASSGGTGIGLAYSKMVIEAMHGSIGVESSPEGTTFTLKLPKGKNQRALNT